MDLYTNILVAIDFSDEARIVINKAHKIALANHAKLNLLHVVKPLSVAYGIDTGYTLSQLEEEMISCARQQMAKLASEFNIHKDRQYIIHGALEKEVHSIAKQIEADLIITGNHGKHGLSLILGSTSSSLLHGAPCDVFTILIGKH